MHLRDPDLTALATLIAMADADEVIRLRVLRAIRDVLWQQEWQQAKEDANLDEGTQ